MCSDSVESNGGWRTYITGRDTGGEAGLELVLPVMRGCDERIWRVVASIEGCTILIFHHVEQIHMVRYGSLPGYGEEGLNVGQGARIGLPNRRVEPWVVGRRVN